MAGYHEVVYDDGDAYRGEWNSEGKVCYKYFCYLYLFQFRWLRLMPNAVFDVNTIAYDIIFCLQPFDSMQREGYGVLTFADGSRYSGRFQSGMCTGYGVMTFPGKSEFVMGDDFLVCVSVCFLHHISHSAHLDTYFFDNHFSFSFVE
jgi:hypothetical protein